MDLKASSLCTLFATIDNASHLSKDEPRQRRAATVRGALEGGLAGTGIAFPAFYLLNKRSSYYRSFPLPIRLLGGVIIVAPLVAIQAERRSLEFEHQHCTELGMSHLERREHEERERWARLSRKDKAAEWAAKHQLSVIMGSWATTMAVAGSMVMRDPLLTMPQKVVQVRLWAQGLTIGVVIAAAAFTHAQRAEATEMRKHGDHFWQHALEDERLEKDPQNLKKTSNM